MAKMRTTSTESGRCASSSKGEEGPEETTAENRPRGPDRADLIECYFTARLLCSKPLCAVRSNEEDRGVVEERRLVWQRKNY